MLVPFIQVRVPPSSHPDFQDAAPSSVANQKRWHIWHGIDMRKLSDLWCLSVSCWVIMRHLKIATVLCKSVSIYGGAMTSFAGLKSPAAIELKNAWMAYYYYYRPW